MNCPYCQKQIPDTDLARHLASKGGSKSKRKITPAQQRKMQAARSHAAKEQSAKEKA